jgi:GNAT superfamily N-acetyltransferase
VPIVGHGGVIVRTATPDDLDLLCRLRIEFLCEVRGLDPAGLRHGFDVETRAFFERTRAAGTIRSWLAEDTDAVVGTVSVLIHDVPPMPDDPRMHEGFVVNMYVRPHARGRGTGRSLLDACIGDGPDRGIRRFSLYATPAGRPVYVDAGFTTHPDWLVLAVPGDA